MSEIRIGISGWTYPPWRGRFYPQGWPHHRELEYAARQVSTIEINGSFYSLQRPESYRAWYEATPEGFVLSVKGSRFITHMKRLKNVETPLANFFASGVLQSRGEARPVSVAFCRISVSIPRSWAMARSTSMAQARSFRASALEQYQPSVTRSGSWRRWCG